MSSDLAARNCEPCRIGTPPLNAEAAEQLRSQVPDWEIVDNHHLHRTFKFRNFTEALSFTNRVGEVAEAEGHHPDIHLTWGKVGIDVWTHKAGGLTDNDFIVAAKIDLL